MLKRYLDKDWNMVKLNSKYDGIKTYSLNTGVQ